MSALRGEPGITVEGVWKKFQRGERHDSLRDLIPGLARRLTRGRQDPATLEARDFWALRDIGFEVKPGQAMGIIGHNGAGKSTLLKLITRIMRPTLGRCEVRGRVGALIELAAGFHPDLTGRENVYLQGAIMGMPTGVIRQRFDQIVEFAGIAAFIDTPVKRYSSGMNARLGFGIAAHLEPDVLIIDEVLSVGDLAFQERAFGRMKEIARSGIPVAVVSHQLDRVRELCTEAVLLRSGEVAARGTPDHCIGAYVRSTLGGETGTMRPIPGIEVTSITLEGQGPVRSGERRTIRITGRCDPGQSRTRAFELAARVRSLQSGQGLFETWSRRHGHILNQAGGFELDMDLQVNLQEGLYQVEASVGDAESDEYLGECGTLQLVVEPGVPFVGVVQLNPVLHLQQGGAISEPSGHGRNRVAGAQE
ncbi:MAG: polysaccharide ABC transporter ATP-binding protein [Gemmatimonadales bacterium]